MKTLSDIFDLKLFEQMLEERYIRVQTHPTLPLSIVNYSELAQYSQTWNEVTMNCRGLIYHTDTNEIIARGFKKFFNWDDSSQPYPPSGPCLRMPKMDGSLGILYKYDGEWAVATRGSFASDQAIYATKMLHRFAKDSHTQGHEGYLALDDLRPNRSYLVEIIYPDNRIVVDYGTSERLPLLDVLHTETGKSDLAEFDRVFWLDKIVKAPLPGFRDTMASDIPQGEEGFVFYWPEKDYRVKMKAAEYLELHRMIFSLSARTVWQRLGEGESVESICVKLPDEFHPWVKQIAGELRREQTKILTEVYGEYADIIWHWHGPVSEMPRKWFADKVKALPHKPYLFMLLDGKTIADEVWKTLKPAGGLGVKTISEDVA